MLTLYIKNTKTFESKTGTMGKYGIASDLTSKFSRNPFTKHLIYNANAAAFLFLNNDTVKEYDQRSSNIAIFILIYVPK